MSLIPSGIISLCREQVYENNGAAFWKDSELYNYLSEAEILFSNAVFPLKTTSVISASGGLKEYPQPSGTLEIYRVTWDDCTMIKKNLNDIDDIEGNHYGSSGTMGNPQFYYEDGEVIGLSPTPNADKDLKIWYSYVPPPLSDTSTSFSLPDQYVYPLIHWVLYRCFMKDDDQSKGLAYFRLWSDSLQNAINNYRRRERRNQTVVVHDHNLYPDSIE